MTLRLTIGIDPGASGALAFLADGLPVGLQDMPVMPRKAGGQQVNAAELSKQIRGVVRNHPGAYVVAVLEAVSAMPGQGVSSMFRFGESYGVVRGVLGALGIGIVPAVPQRWKRAMALQGVPKDVARTVAIERFPGVADDLRRKRDVGRADALLIAAWAELTEQIPPPILPTEKTEAVHA